MNGRQRLYKRAKCPSGRKNLINIWCVGDDIFLAGLLRDYRVICLPGNL
jgi:hypothetical protein